MHLIGFFALSTSLLLGCGGPTTSGSATGASAPLKSSLSPTSEVKADPPPGGTQPAGLKSACEAIRTRHEMRVGEAEKADTPLEKDIVVELRKLGACVPAGRGSWVMAHVDVAISTLTIQDTSPNGDPYSVNAGTVGLEIVYVDDAGKELRSDSLVDILNVIQLDMGPLRVFDFNGDGVGEFVHCYSYAAVSEDNERGKTCRVLQAKAGSIGVYEGLPKNITIEEMEDVDEDGRLDLVSFSPYDLSYSGPCSRKACVEHPIPGPVGFLYHSQRDGTFSATDPVAMAHARKMFTYDMRELFQSISPLGIDGAAFWPGVNAVRGALAFGEDPKKVQSELKAARKRFCRTPAKCPELDKMESWPKSPLFARAEKRSAP
jgi:hypothetical protein